VTSNIPGFIKGFLETSCSQVRSKKKVEKGGEVGESPEGEEWSRGSIALFIEDGSGFQDQNKGQERRGSPQKVPNE